MKDDIKEIINYFKDDIEFLEKELKNPNFLGRYITIRDKECDYLKRLLDYITNLQKTQETLIKNDNEIITNLQEKLKEANESITWWSNRFKAVEKDNTKLKQEKDKYYEENLIISQEILNLQEELESKNKEIKDLKNRLYTITTKFN